MQKVSDAIPPPVKTGGFLAASPMTAAILPSMKKHIRQSFDSKLLQTQGIIAKWIRSCPPEKQAVGFSGGKDSTVVLQLVMGAASAFLPEGSFQKISVVFENTGVEYPE